MHESATDEYDFLFDTFSQTPLPDKVIMILDDLYSEDFKKSGIDTYIINYLLKISHL